MIDEEYVRKLMSDIEEAIAVILEDVSKPFDTLTRTEKSEVRYYMIVVVEALTALCYHIVRRAYGVKPETPIKTLNALMERGLLKADEFEDLVKLIRLRNLLVRRYWVINDKRVYDAVRKDFKSVKRFLEGVRNEFNL